MIRMGGPEVWARVSKGGVRREGGEGKKEEEGELKKGELCEFARFYDLVHNQDHLHLVRFSMRF